MSGEVRLEQASVTAREEDVSTLDGILRAFYEVISGPSGEARDWQRDRTLYAPGALFVPCGTDGQNKFAVVMDHEAYIKRSDPVFAEGFYEREIHRVTHTFGNVTHVFSTYEARWSPDGPVIVRGVNSIELVFAGNRWWILAALWDTERPENPIPKELLPD